MIVSFSIPGDFQVPAFNSFQGNKPDRPAQTKVPKNGGQKKNVSHLHRKDLDLALFTAEETSHFISTPPQVLRESGPQPNQKKSYQSM